jgi:hypothetical protein
MYSTLEKYGIPSADLEKTKILNTATYNYINIGQ